MTPVTDLRVKRLAYIDTWRAIAVALVIVGHLSLNTSLVSWLAAHHVRGIFGYSRLGVMIFFFISGFVVTKACLAEGATFTARGFYIKRAFRIIPPLLLYLLACAALGAVGWLSFDLRDFASAFLYACNTSLPGVRCSWLVGHMWSLAFEEQFYLLFAWVFLFALGRRPTLVALAAVLPLVLAPLVFPVRWIGWIGFLVTYGLFALGYVCARHEQAVLAMLRPRAWLAFLVGAAACAFRPEAIGAVAPSYQLVYLAAIPLMVLASGQLSGAVASAFRIPAVVYFGQISYGVYLWQQLVNSAPFAKLHPIAQLGCVAVMIAWCAFLFANMERPLIQLGHRLARGKPSGQGLPVGVAESR